MRRWSGALVVTLAVIVVVAWRLAGAPSPPAGAAAVRGGGSVLYRCTMPECGDVGSTDPSSRCPVCGMKREPVGATAESTAPWYVCPMDECNDPGSDDPESRCPVCGMRRQLVAGGGGAPLEVALSPRAVALAELATEPLTRGPLYRRVRALGAFEVDERRQAVVNARVAGTIERLAADQTGMRVRRGEALLEVYSLSLLEAQNELLRLEWGFGRIEGRGRNRSVSQDLVTARHRLQLLGMSADEIDAMVEEDHENPYLMVRAPLDGTIVRKGVAAGQYVQVGDLLFEIVDLSQLWLQLACYEDDLAWLAVGQEVVARTQSAPGEDLHGRVSFIEPVVDVATRTARVRVEVANPRRRLKPGMFATAWISSELSSADPAGHLRVPRQAVLEAGGRALVYVEVAPGVYRGIDVRLGPLAQDEEGRACYQVVSGLSGEERVVTRGAFAIDSQAQLEGKPSLFAAVGRAEETTGSAAAVDPGDHHEQLLHGEAGESALRPAALAPRPATQLPLNEYCPVHPEQPVDPTIYVVHRGVRVHLCTHRCPRLFIADPERYVPELPLEMRRRMSGGSEDNGTTPDG